jgi:hypothetical protein
VTIEHYIVFIGAAAPLVTELLVLEKRIHNARLIAPAVGKNKIGATNTSIDLAISKLIEELTTANIPSELARLSLWMYEPNESGQFEQVWKLFGHSAWLETIPRKYINKLRPTREFVEKRINEIRPLLHEVSNETYSSRKSSPFSLPLRNFRSQITRDLKQYWYNDLDKSNLSEKIKVLKMRFSQTKDKTAGGFKDEKSLIFKPAKDTECHGKPHPLGNENKSFACGRFRYGVSLFPGFHYDVSSNTSSTIQCELRTSSGSVRSIKSENRQYINIFPNDHLLPEK